MIRISLEQRTIVLSRKEQSLANAAAQRSAMLPQFKKMIAAKRAVYSPIASIAIPPTALEPLTKKYSEQLVYKPLEEMQHWFTYSIGAFLEPDYPQLYYHAHLLTGKKTPPSKSAVAAIGEAIAGLVGQRIYRATKLARPNHDFPDIVMEGRGRTLLIEAKATSGTSVQAKQAIEDNLTRMVCYTAACFELDSRPVMGVLVSTALEKVDHFHTCITEVMPV